MSDNQREYENLVSGEDYRKAREDARRLKDVLGKMTRERDAAIKYAYAITRMYERDTGNKIADQPCTYEGEIHPKQIARVRCLAGIEVKP